MRFEGRELKPYAEPVPASSLREGAVYFSVNFHDEAMQVPALEPVVFVGKNLDPGDERQVYFQDFESYRNGARYKDPEPENDSNFFKGSEDRIGHIFEYDKALDVLLACALRRQKRQ